MSTNDFRPRSREFAPLNPAAPKPVVEAPVVSEDQELEQLAAEIAALDSEVVVVIEEPVVDEAVVVEEAPIFVAHEIIEEAPPVVEVSAPVEQPAVVAISGEPTPLYLTFIQQHYGYTGETSNAEAWGTFCMRFPGMRAHAGKHPDMRLLSSDQLAILTSNIA